MSGHRQVTSCNDIELLIPWYVNGTLNECEMDAVNGHLRDCRRCRGSVEQEVRSARELGADPPGLDPLVDSADTSWVALTARLPGRRWLPASQAPAPVGVMIALMLSVAAGSFLLGRQMDRPAYETLTAPSSHDGPVVQVMFEADTPEHVIRGVVLESGGTLIGGPTATGIYRIGLEPDRNGEHLVARLRRSSAVHWITLEAP